MNLKPYYLIVTLLFLWDNAGRSEDTLFSNFGSYVTIEHQEGLGTDSILIITKGNAYLGEVEADGTFNAYGGKAGTSVWGYRAGPSQVFLLRTPAVDEE
ncbi:MAG: hypothetical protein O2830_01765 [Verrucomicrobia bacterium]|nr:hypothetical protein [Verrucomicrobiota bacterium]